MTVRLLAQALDLTADERSRLLAAARPTTTAADVVACPPSLPRYFTPLIGRGDDVAVVKLLVSDRRLVTLTGTGGVGKTRLAVEVAAQMLGEFDRVVFVELAPLGDPEYVLNAIAASMSIREEAVTPLLDLVAAGLSSGRPLLILDNMEHLLPARDTVLSLLGARPNLRVLITSREALHVRGERIYTLAPLPLPERDADIQHSPAVRLFRERACEAGTMVGSDVLTDRAVADICRRLDGLPLAIELAAAWTPLLPRQALLERLTSRLPYLDRGPQDLPARQRTMRDTIAWSYHLLSAEEQALFARLSVFAGGCTLQGAETVCNPAGDLPVLSAMGSLVERSLIRQEGRGEPRFFMLETIGEYAAEKLMERDETQTIRAAHASYFLEVAEGAERHYYDARSAEFLNLLEAERANLRAALDWNLRGGDPLQGVLLAGALYRFWELHGHLAEGQHWLASVLAREDELGPPATILPERDPDQGFPAMSGAMSPWGRVLAGAAVMAGSQGDHKQAKLRCEQRLEVSRRLDDSVGVMCALHDLGITAALEGDFVQAADFFKRCVELNRGLEDKASQATTLGNLGWALRRLGDDARAMALLEEARELFREVGNPPHAASVLLDLADVAASRGDVEQALILYREGGTLLQKFGDRVTVPDWFDGLAAVVGSQGQGERAARLWGAGAALRDAIGAPLPLADRRTLDETMGRIRAQIGDKAWRLAWKAGWSMSLEEAMTDALG